MKLNSDQLNAFFQVVKTGSFTAAAHKLALSQPALSLRIQKLESELKTSLIVRESAGLKLTAAGEKLLLHCQLRENIELDLLKEFTENTTSNSLRGVLRIVGFSTTLRSVLLPSLNPLIQKNPGIHLEAFIREMREIPVVLKRAEADFAITEEPIQLGGVENIFLGFEENVLVEGKKIIAGREEIYLDNDYSDQATFNFLKKQKNGETLDLRRNYLDEVYTILDAVEMGWGRSVQPRHLIKGRENLKIVKDFKSVKAPIYLNYLRQPYYLKIHEQTKTCILQGYKERLSQA